MVKKQLGKISGVVEIDTCTVFTRILENQVAKFKIHENQVVGNFNGKVARGSVRSEFSYDLSQKRVVTIDFKASKCQIALLCPYKIDGQLSLEASAKLQGDTILEGSGKVEIKKFEDHKSDLLSELRQTLRLIGIENVQFDHIEVPFSIVNREIKVDSLNAESQLLDVAGKGEVSLKSGRYGFDVVGVVPQTMKESVPRIIWGGLDDDSLTGGKKFTGTVQGFRDNYSVKVDKRIIRQSARSFFKNLFN